VSTFLGEDQSLKSIWNIGTKIDGEEQEEYFYQLDLSSLNSGKDQKIKFSLIKDQKDDEDFDDEFKELLNCEIEGDVTIFQPSAGGFAAKKITATNDFDTDLFKTQLEADDFCKEKLFVEENHSFIFSYIQNENVLKILGSKNLDLLIFTKK
jgi:hypothetical protein